MTRAQATEAEMAELRDAVAQGRESARTEPLLDDEDVFAMAREGAERDPRGWRRER